MAALGFREDNTRFDALLEVILRQRSKPTRADLIAEHRVRRTARFDRRQNIRRQRLNILQGQLVFERVSNGSSSLQNA